MGYLITQIVFCLIAASVLGLFVGWLLWGRSAPAPDCSDLERELEDAQDRIRFLEARSPRPSPEADTPPRRESVATARSADVYTAPPPVSPLEPIGAPDADDLAGGDGPAEATFSDDVLVPPRPASPSSPEVAQRPPSPAYDDLKRISGIGPAIESQLAEIGITTYRQIAHFSDDDIDRVGAHIDFFPDRIRREGWVVQAAALHRETYGTRP